ncbi:MAG: hypothetical protein WBD31_03655 [Rubripirellula sp.]
MAGGYPYGMPADMLETLFTPKTALWFVVAFMAASILMGSLNRRRAKLTGTLKDYVERSQSTPKKELPPDEPDAS